MGATGHFLTPEKALSALTKVKHGRIIDFSHTIEMVARLMAPNTISSSATAKNSMKVQEQMGAKNKVGANLERIKMTTHIGTYIDYLGHFSIGEHLYGGHTIEDSVGDWGLLNLGIENVPPIITRGICLDVSGLDGTAHLAAGRAVTTEDLERAYDTAEINPQKGDMVFLITDWGKYFISNNEKHLAGEPGLDINEAHWLTKQDTISIGVDNMAVEVTPGTNHLEIMMPVHEHCLAEAVFILWKF